MSAALSAAAIAGACAMVRVYPHGWNTASTWPPSPTIVRAAFRSALIAVGWWAKLSSTRTPLAASPRTVSRPRIPP